MSNSHSFAMVVFPASVEMSLTVDSTRVCILLRCKNPAGMHKKRFKDASARMRYHLFRLFLSSAVILLIRDASAAKFFVSCLLVLPFMMPMSLSLPFLADPKRLRGQILLSSASFPIVSYSLTPHACRSEALVWPKSLSPAC